MKRTHWAALVVACVVLGAGAWLALRPRSGLAENPSDAPASTRRDGHVVMTVGDSVQAGRYLVQIGGCNDCHTPGWDRAPGKIPESDWLTGVPLGWQGPWGTTYAANLRLFIPTMTEDAWVKLAHTRTALPPMPWSTLNDMSEQDLRSVYQFIKSLGPKGQQTPPDLPPGQKPKTPYLELLPKMPS